MKTFKYLSLIILTLFLISACAEARTKRKKINGKIPAKTSKAVMKSGNDYKILAEGFNSRVETPFVFVAHDAETYALLRSLIGGLPPSETIDFNKTAVVAGFAGEKNTGGYSVKIHPAAEDKIAVEVRAPEKGAMTTQVIRSPFQAVVVPLVNSQSVSLEIPSAWKNRIQNYEVSKASFESSGGFAGRVNKFSAEGTIGVLKYGEFVTFFFNLSGKEAENLRQLPDVASGVSKEGKISISRVDAGTFAQTPRPPLKVFGMETSNKLSLLFESLPPTVADGFMVRGKLDAVTIK